MAFKTRTQPAPAQSPYAMTDRFHFRDRNGAPRAIHRGVVTLLADERANSPRADLALGDVAYRASVEKNSTPQPITLVFKGQRATDLKNGQLMAAIEQQHHARCDANDWDRPLTHDLIVEGAWLPRTWKDANGTKHTHWEMLVAQWHFTPAGTKTVLTEGALPDHNA